MINIKKTFAGLALSCLASVGLLSVAHAKPYKGAEVFTNDSALYGKFVIRMRAAKASGVISNFFLWKPGSEMDSIFWEEVDIEIFGKNNATSWQSNIISGLGDKKHSEEIHTNNGSFGDKYYTFAIEWTPNKVRWLIDNQVVRTTNGGQASDLNSLAQMRINFWPPGIPEWVGNWSDSVLPLYMFVNWIEYHSWSNGQFEFEWRDDFNQLDAGRWGTADWTFDENRADFSPRNVVTKNGYLVLAMTKEGQEGYNGNPPVDNEISAPSSSSSVAPSSSSIASSSSSAPIVASSSSAISSSSESSSAQSSAASSSSTVKVGAFNLSMLISLLLLSVSGRLVIGRKTRR